MAHGLPPSLLPTTGTCGSFLLRGAAALRWVRGSGQCMLHRGASTLLQ